MKWRKFADKQTDKEQRTDRQTDGSKTETTLSSLDTRGSWSTGIHDLGSLENLEVMRKYLLTINTFKIK